MLAYLLYKCMKFVDKCSKSGVNNKKHVQEEHFYYAPENVYFYNSLFYTVKHCEANLKKKKNNTEPFMKWKQSSFLRLDVDVDDQNRGPLDVPMGLMGNYHLSAFSIVLMCSIRMSSSEGEWANFGYISQKHHKHHTVWNMHSREEDCDQNEYNM